MGEGWLGAEMADSAFRQSQTLEGTYKKSSDPMVTSENWEGEEKKRFLLAEVRGVLEASLAGVQVPKVECHQYPRDDP